MLLPGPAAAREIDGHSCQTCGTSYGWRASILAARMKSIQLGR